MSRRLNNWLDAFVDYASFGEAPEQMYFWTGVSTLAGVLRRRVWIDQAYFSWYPNFYVVLVAPPGIVSKSTTASIGINLLKEVPGIHFGPDVVTSQALIGAFETSTEEFELNGAFYPMSAVTISSSEFGNLLNPQDKAMVDLLVDLWDGRDTFTKLTKMSGNNEVRAPWINLIACTTPSWIGNNFPEYMVGGGLVSRMIFVYAEQKRRYVAYPGLAVPKDHSKMKEALVSDLVHIAAKLCGPYSLTTEAVAWGEDWYKDHFERVAPTLSDQAFGGYIARKQTHMHKLAMVLSAARKDELVIDVDDLARANVAISALEDTMPKIFKQIGRTEESRNAEKFLEYVQRRGKVPFAEAYRYVKIEFPGWKEFENMTAAAIRSGQMKLMVLGGVQHLAWNDTPSNPEMTD